MHFNIIVIAALIAWVAAYPGTKAEVRTEPGFAESNCGFFPCVGFNATEQYVDVRPGSGHEFMPPKATDVRGPCPGLNAAANHQFVSHTGILNYRETVNGLFNALGLSHEFGVLFFVFAIFSSGSIIDMKWSIGGPLRSSSIVGGSSLGLSNSHNLLEGDASASRQDACINKGDAHSLNLVAYAKMLSLIQNGGNYNMALTRKHTYGAHEYSISHNPYAFFGPAFFIPPVMQEFIVTMMSNHSSENPGGFLYENVLNSFFSVQKNQNGTLTWIKGHDRIPINWYKRPNNNAYSTTAAFGDFAITIVQHPKIGELGGNLAKVNSFRAVNITELTSGFYNAADLTKGGLLSCFAFQGLCYSDAACAQALKQRSTPFGNLAYEALTTFFNDESCPHMTQADYKASLFKNYPGTQCHLPIQPDTPY